MKKRYVDVHPSNVMNLPMVRSWFEADADKELGFDRAMVVLGDNRAALAQIYGKRHQTFTSEFRYDIWRIEFEGLYFWLLSAKAKGTCIEVESPEVWGRDDGYHVVSFLNSLYADLKELEDKADESGDD